ncbi:MAG: redoxin family protein [Planctomycetes bacterium]|nr:redoxin family protein [Planctomycetota bacterium]MBI3835413.1 redoxin family protein [Planctomycetota bacterium]
MKIVIRTACVLMAIPSMLGLARAEGTTLGIGDPAPTLSIKEWVRGDAVNIKKDAAQKLHIVEFWATWCGPCKASIPLLSKYQEKYKKDLVIIGVTDPDPLRNSPTEIRDFVKSQGKDMSYTVAMDDDGKTTDAYMNSSGAIGIPHAFVVNKENKIVWQGSPLDPELDSVLGQVIAGKYDLAVAKANAAKDQMLDEKFQALEVAYQMGKMDEVWKGVEEILKMDPANETAMQLLAGLYTTDSKYADRYKKWVRADIDANHGNAKAMHVLAMSLSTNDDFATRLPDLALEAAKACYDATQPRASSAAEIYARALYQIGDLDKAIKIQEEALSLGGEAEKDPLKATLAYYQQCKKLRG